MSTEAKPRFTYLTRSYVEAMNLTPKSGIVSFEGREYALESNGLCYTLIEREA